MQVGHLRFELGAQLEYVTANGFEFFVADDAFEGGAPGERHLVDDCEHIGEGDAFEGIAIMECASANSFEFFIEVDALEGSAFEERSFFNDFEVIG